VILASQAAKVDFLFKQLGTPGSRALVEKYVKPVEFHKPIPEALKATARRAPERAPFGVLGQGCVALSAASRRWSQAASAVEGGRAVSTMKATFSTTSQRKSSV
jgi:hypothetical protein